MDLSLSELSTPRPVDGNDIERPLSSRNREERLQNDLFKLRKINDAMSAYLDALSSVQTSTQVVSRRMEATNRLLNQYIDVMWQTEQTARLVFDPEWRGGESDELFLERQRLVREEQERKEREEQERALREDAERKERERLEQERLQAEKERQASRVPAVRGVRGLRARVHASTMSRAGTARGRGVSRTRGDNGG